jgi:hypothetical protein
MVPISASSCRNSAPPEVRSADRLVGSEPRGDQAFELVVDGCSGTARSIPESVPASRRAPAWCRAPESPPPDSRWPCSRVEASTVRNRTSKTAIVGQFHVPAAAVCAASSGRRLTSMSAQAAAAPGWRCRAKVVAAQVFRSKPAPNPGRARSAPDSRRGRRSGCRELAPKRRSRRRNRAKGCFVDLRNRQPAATCAATTPSACEGSSTNCVSGQTPGDASSPGLAE